MEALYDNLLEYFDDLFPLSTDRINFIQDHLTKSAPFFGKTKRSPKILDIGCATGATSLALMRQGMDVTGVDINAEMIRSACRRNPEPKTNARFLRMDMRELADYFAAHSFDGILCLGNTLAHLEDTEEIGAFIRDLKTLLRPGGVCVFELVNFKRVLAEKIQKLPTIETIRCRFVRNYSESPDGHIFFDATIFSSSGQAVFKDRIALYPLRSDQLEIILTDNGFSRTEWHNDFDSGKLDGTGLGVVCVAYA
jgi:SAM-dependent methyltransferase